MKSLTKQIFLYSSLFVFASCVTDSFKEGFQSLSADYRPMPFWHIRGDVEKSEIMKQIGETDSARFGGVTFLPI